MADRVVIYDPDLQLGAVIDTDGMRALGPVGGGPNAKGELSQFIGLMPDTVWNLSTYDLAKAYMEFWSENFASLYDTPESSAPSPVEQPANPPSAPERQATAEATATAASPPPLAPADTDPEAAPDTPPTVAPAEQYAGPCFACNGSGNVAAGADGALTTCNLCKGTGNLPAPA